MTWKKLIQEIRSKYQEAQTLTDIEIVEKTLPIDFSKVTLKDKAIANFEKNIMKDETT